MQTYKINPKMGGGLNNQVFAEDDNHISARILRLYDRRKDILGPWKWHGTLLENIYVSLNAFTEWL